MSGFLEILRSIFTEIFSITVPGFENVTFFQLLATLMLLSFGVGILRFLLGLPGGAIRDEYKVSMRESFKASRKGGK